MRFCSQVDDTGKVVFFKETNNLGLINYIYQFKFVIRLLVDIRQVLKITGIRQLIQIHYPAFRVFPKHVQDKIAPDKAEAAADGKQYVVQIAALADAGKAREVQQQLSAKGLRVYTEKVKTASGEVTRVRVGPFPSREAADKERGQLRALGFDGNVMPR